MKRSVGLGSSSLGWALLTSGLLLLASPSAAQAPRRPVRSISLGALHACAQLADTSVRCRGSNTYGELPVGTPMGTAQPAWLTAQLPPGTRDVVAGGGYTLFLRSDASVWAQGIPLGVAPSASPDPADSIARPIAGLGPASALAPGDGFACALLVDGRVMCWGVNDYGQLGDGTRADRAHAAPVVGLSDVVALASGYNHSCAAQRGGDVWCWGMNWHGDIGAGPRAPSGRSFPRPVRVSGVDRVVDLAVGGHHSCALRDDGTVWCWGSDAQGEVGLDAGVRDYPTPQQVPGLDGVTMIRAGDYGTCALRLDGRVLCWGQLLGAPLGAPDGHALRRPTLVPAVVDVSSIDVSNQQMCAVRRDGDLVCVGASPAVDAGERPTRIDLER